ncbi:CbiX/SirB N-terminal domain-containing protein [Gemmobacter serpentinus]|uniref:CbiX/SirB N-terminal domain-containing protein n=1 Tax=Gemmobacter serpentinus TaxID=2652247 RepID=UPI00124D6BC5|nr:CbiX/SirB N-terminal domain-containing protein [Gemmobacter serpentinus]
MQNALIIAHGSPADPEPQEAALQALAARVGTYLPGWCLRGTTLALPGALDRAVAAQPDALIFPFFMAEGWFTRQQLPRRLAEAGMVSPRQTPAFGHHPRLLPLLAKVAEQAALAQHLPPDTTLLLAAHGSQASRASATRTEELAAQLREVTRFRIVTGYLEEAPFVVDQARDLGPALCLPLFATRAGHVAQDLPAALTEAGFTGKLLPAIGEHTRVPAMIAEALVLAN